MTHRQTAPIIYKSSASSASPSVEGVRWPEPGKCFSRGSRGMGKGSILMVRIMIIMVGMIIWRIWMIWIIVDDFECELIWKDTQQYNATMPGEGTEHCWYLWMIWLNISRTFMWRGRSRFFVPFSYQKKLCYWFFPFDRCWVHNMWFPFSQDMNFNI